MIFPMLIGPTELVGVSAAQKVKLIKLLFNGIFDSLGKHYCPDIEPIPFSQPSRLVKAHDTGKTVAI
jgi:hypothetical protein